MAARSKPSAALVAGLSLVLACTPVCDEAGLRRVAEAFAGGEPARRQDGVTALRAACPTLPPTLASSLVIDELPVGAGSQLQRERADDAAWRELLARTCPTIAGERPPELAEFADPRRACDLDRYELRAPDTVFAGQDIAVYMLYEWLLDARVDRELAAGVARPLLASHTLAGRGVALPQSTIDLPPSGGPAIWISASAVSVDDVAVVSLTRGLAAPDEFVDHVSPALRGALAELHRRGREQAEQRGTAWDARARVLADRATPMATFIATLHTATRAGFRSFELVVHDGARDRGLPLAVPDTWLSPDATEPDHESLGLRFEVHAGVVVVSYRQMSVGGSPQGPGRTYTRSTCAPGAADCLELADLVAFLQKMKSLYPRDAVATFRLDGAVTLQALVDIVDVVRGEGCVLHGSSETTWWWRERCLFWQAVVDLDPPIDPGV